MKQGRMQRLVGYMMVATAAILQGVSGNLSRLLFDDGISPLTLNEFRMLIATICLFFTLLVWKRSLIKLPFGDWGWIIVFGLSLAIQTYAYFFAISRLPLAITLVILSSATAWIPLGQAIWQKRLPSRSLIISVIFTLSGIILLVGIEQGDLTRLDVFGFLVALFALLSYIVYLLCGQRVGRTLPALTSTCYGTLIASIFWFVVQPLWLIPASTWQPQRFLLILLVGIIGMALPFTLVLAALRHIDATRVSLISNLDLVAASVIAYFWLGQRLTIGQVMGCILIFSGVIILQFERQSRVGN